MNTIVYEVNGYIFHYENHYQSGRNEYFFYKEKNGVVEELTDNELIRAQEIFGVKGKKIKISKKEIPSIDEYLKNNK